MPVVRARTRWQAHAHAMTPGHYASDFDFIASIWQAAPKVIWHEVIASKALQQGHGAPETGVERAIDRNVVQAERRRRK
jgi:hypothetical protein